MKATVIVLSSTLITWPLCIANAQDFVERHCAENLLNDIDDTDLPASFYLKHRILIDCATSDRELSELAQQIHAGGRAMPPDIIDKLHDQIAERQQEISIFNDPIIVDNLLQMDKIIEDRFAQRRNGGGTKTDIHLMTLEARHQAIEELEAWMNENPRHSRWKRIVASDQIVSKILALPKYNRADDGRP